MSDHAVARAVEALLFLSPEPLSVVELCEITGEAPGPDTGLEVAEIAGGWAMRTRADLAAVCDRLRERPGDDRISPAALETLAVIAYMGPIGRPEIGRLRGVAVDSTVNSLLERGLIEEAGRPRGGGAMRYRTTRLFQERFGLRHAGDLPPLEDFELTGDEAERVRRQLIDAGHITTSPEEGDGG